MKPGRKRIYTPEEAYERIKIYNRKYMRKRYRTNKKHKDYVNKLSRIRQKAMQILAKKHPIEFKRLLKEVEKHEHI